MKVIFETIYERIGYLFYAVASNKHSLSVEEVGHLHRVVESSWQPPANADASLHLHLLNCIHAGITLCKSERMDVQHAFRSFVDYFNMHSAPFNKELRERILHTIKLIDHDFHMEDRDHPMKEQLAQLFLSVGNPVI